MTALMYAAQQGYDDIVRILVEKEVGMQDDYGRTALYYATYSSSNKECA